MKKILLSAVLFLATAGINAQDWYITLNSEDGLPGELQSFMGSGYYEFTSELLTPGVTTKKVRMTVVDTQTHEMPNGNNCTFALSELKIYDKDGMIVPYTASSNADHNRLSLIGTDGAGLPGLSDNNYKTYFHSMWAGQNAVADYHYIELQLDRSVDAFTIQWSTRLNEPKNSPTTVGITLGTEYAPSSIGSEFVLGDVVTTEQELTAEKQLFVLKGNAVESFTASNGTKYNGSGPLYMLYAEEGDKEPSFSHVMQLIPVGDGRYLVYWPAAGRFLANSSSSYNGANGWQYSTNIFSSAAYVKLTATEGGFFEMQYDGANSAGPLTLYVGAEMRDGVDSKMKTFDLAHKQALERGDYTQGFGLPIAFNWSIYKAGIGASTADEVMVTVPQLARTRLATIIEKANGCLTTYGNHDGYCTAGEDNALRQAINNIESTIPSMSTINEITSAESFISLALSRYMAAGLSKYETQVNSLLAGSTFSEPPYTAGTYPIGSRSILTGILSTISTAKEKVDTYDVEQYETIYEQIERDIEKFLATKVKDSGESGDGNGEEEIPEEDPEDGETVYVYLSNGDIDAYSLASLDGEYYIESGTLYFPLSDNDTKYYTKEEYDSCSTIRPQLPTMTSFKFNNKYNPNLNVDVICDPVGKNMTPSVNSIGKWLTASFQLSDENAVAFVDTVLQESKVTRQSFANTVSYKVTYPGYNIIKRVKIQDEIWTEEVVSGESVEVPLTADMLYTNKPSQNSSEAIANLLDNNPSTIFHSTWGSANNATLNVNTYIEIDLPEQLENIQLYYKCRPGTGYNPLVWEIYGLDGSNWELVRTLDYINDNMPTGGNGQEYTSPAIPFGKQYSKLRIVQTSGEYAKNHLVLSELRLYKVITGETKEPEKIQDAVYENRRVPFGNTYNVDIEWLTDKIAAVPRIDIDIEGGNFVTSKDYYLKAKFTISGNGVYEDFEDSVQIKGRGNSTWSYSKKPYRLKFAEKVKPFGLTKGKSWVLLANAQRGSLMANAIAMKAGQMAGAKYTNHIIPVDLYMNGRYLGNYMFTEKVGMANNSVDLDEALGYVVELDTYGSSDEPIYRTGVYNLPVKVAEPDLADLTSDSAQVRLERIKADSKAMQDAIFYNGDIESVLDLDATARFFLANDLVLNQEINHPKSTFYHKDESVTNGKIAFGPLWDFDWAFDYENNSNYCYSGTTSSVIKSMEASDFWTDLTRIEIFKKYYYKVWKEFIENGSVEELVDYIDDYYNFSKSSFDNNAYTWGYDNGFSEEDRDRAKQWIADRAEFIYNNLDEYDIDDIIQAMTGDVNGNGTITIHDAVLIALYLNGTVHDTFSEARADVDGSGKIDSGDITATADIILSSDAPSSMYWYKTPAALGEFTASNFSIELGGEANVPLKLMSYREEGYNAIQFDVTVPDGLNILDITAGEPLSGYRFMYSPINMNQFRVVAYSEGNAYFNSGYDVVANISLSANTVIEEADRKLNICNAYAVTNSDNEVRMNNFTVRFDEITGIDTTLATAAVSGGDYITVTALEEQEIEVYSVDGRLVKKVNVKAGTTIISLPAGIYIVNGEKVAVY